MSSRNIFMIAWIIFEFSYVIGLRISRLMLAESIVLYWISHPTSNYKGGAIEIFMNLKMIMMIGWFK